MGKRSGPPLYQGLAEALIQTDQPSLGAVLCSSEELMISPLIRLHGWSKSSLGACLKVHMHCLMYIMNNDLELQISSSTFTNLKANSEDDKLMTFSYFSQKTGFDLSCKLSPLETICMKGQILFSEKDKKNIEKMPSAENFTQSA